MDLRVHAGKPDGLACARARAACRQPARLLISRARWLLNARPVAKTDALIVFLSEFWV